MKTWKKRTGKQNKGDVRESVTLIYNCKVLPASSIFTKNRTQQGPIYKRNLKTCMQKIIKWPCIKVHSYSRQRKPDDKPSCLLSQKSCSIISISTITACSWCQNDGRKIMGEVFKVEYEMHTHTARCFCKDVCAMQDLHFTAKNLPCFYWSAWAATKLRQGFYKWWGFAWLWGSDSFSG